MSPERLPRSRKWVSAMRLMISAKSRLLTYLALTWSTTIAMPVLIEKVRTVVTDEQGNYKIVSGRKQTRRDNDERGLTVGHST